MFYYVFVAFAVLAMTNAVNLTDGLDGLTTGITSIIAVGLGVLAYLSSNVNYASYLNIMYIPAQNIGMNKIPISNQPLKNEKVPAGKNINKPTKTIPNKNLVKILDILIIL